MERTYIASGLPDDLVGLTAVQWNELTDNLLDCDLDSLANLHTDVQSAPASAQQPVALTENGPTQSSSGNVQPEPCKVKLESGVPGYCVELGDELGLDADLQSGSKSCSINKARREKLRRERLNERFAELGALLNLKGTNIDKLRVLSEAIHALQRLLDETKSLKSTNQHLRMANTMTSEMAMSLLKAQGTEGEEGEAGTLSDAPSSAAGCQLAAPPGTTAAPATATPPLPAPVPAPPVVDAVLCPPAKRTKLSNADAAVPTSTTPPGKLPTQPIVPPWQVPGQGLKLPPIHGMVMPNMTNIANVANMSNAWMMTPNGMLVPVLNAPMSMWMPPSAQDTSQDHILRPPVA